MKHDFLYSVEREYPVGIDRLWELWTTASELEKWYHPTELGTVPGTFTSVAVEGGLWTAAIDVPAFEFVAYFFGWYTNVVPLERLEHTMSYTQSKDEWLALDQDAPHHKVVVEFESRGDNSWVKFSQYGEMPAEQIEATTVGMQSYFESLANYIAS